MAPTIPVYTLQFQKNTDGNFVFDGALLTPHDREWFDGQRFVGTAVLTTEAATDNAPPHWDFDQTTVERIKWFWTPGDGWRRYTVRMWWLQTGGGSGNVVWRYKHTAVQLGDNPTEALTTINTITVPAPGVLGTTFRYDDLAVDVDIPQIIDLGAGPITPRILSVVDRFASDGADTLGNDAGLVAISVTRIPFPGVDPGA